MHYLLIRKSNKNFRFWIFDFGFMRINLNFFCMALVFSELNIRKSKIESLFFSGLFGASIKTLSNFAS